MEQFELIIQRKLLFFIPLVLRYDDTVISALSVICV